MNNRLNAFTVDVEDYFQVENFASQIDRGTWERYPSRIEANTDRVLTLLGRHEVRATFFILSWNAKRFPQLVRAIAGAGHEIASHGYGHQLVYEQEPAEFARDITRAKIELERLAGAPVLGYRAPSYSITAQSRWAFGHLLAAGYRYDSSVYPIRRRRYGIPGAPRFPHRVAEGLVEFPMTTWRVAGVNLPAASGGYLRILPLAVSIAAVSQLNHAGHPAVVNVHPWELDPEQPRIGGGHLGGFTHYANLHTTSDRLTALLDRFRFGTMRQTLEHAGFTLEGSAIADAPARTNPRSA
jgi:polysaccharide deacetylase family protein (PEP-CTERM system associated)